MNISARPTDPLGRTDVQITSNAQRVVVVLDVFGDLRIIPVSSQGITRLSDDMSGPVLICDPDCLTPATKRRLRRLFTMLTETHT